jgi:hypothetical protein
MSLDPDKSTPDFAEPRKPLEMLYETERSLRQKAVGAIVPLLPTDLATTIDETSQQAERSLKILAQIDLEQISDRELRPARTLMGLTFVGFGSLMMLFLMLYVSTLHPELSPIGQIHEYWHAFIWLMGLGVAGLAMLGREAMRPPDEL